MEERELNVMINKVGGNASKEARNYRLSIPTAWAKELGLSEDNRAVIAKFDGKTITLEVKEMKRWIVSLNGKLSIIDYATKHRMDNPVRVSGPHKSEYPEPVMNNIVIDEVEATPEIIAFEKVKDEINRLAASSEQELLHGDYDETLTVALKSVGYDR